MDVIARCIALVMVDLTQPAVTSCLHPCGVKREARVARVVALRSAGVQHLDAIHCGLGTLWLFVT